MNMTYEIYRYIFIIAAILCGIMLVVAIVLFFALKVPKLISDLSGATARKAIKNIREQNEATGDKYHKVSSFNVARGKLTDKISPSGNVIQQSQAHMGFGIDTSKISTLKLDNEVAGETSVLEVASETTVLSASAGETSVLNEEYPAETSVLSETKAPEETESYFEIEYEITYIHTSEVIEVEALA